ncbi:hypothetical protein J6590_102984 [Homalodisca vitripennis]|nr:hypothetical protein J6590_102984 [Homalodisca vitripennis]
MKDRVMALLCRPRQSGQNANIEAYKAAKRTHRQALKVARRNLNEELINTADNKCKAAWTIVNRETGRDRPSHHVQPHAEDFSKYCISAVDEIRQSLSLPSSSAVDLLQRSAPAAPSQLFKIGVQSLVVNKSQFGFRCGMSTIDAVEGLVYHILSKFELGLPTGATLLSRIGVRSVFLSMKVCGVWYEYPVRGDLVRSQSLTTWFSDEYLLSPDVTRSSVNRTAALDALEVLNALYFTNPIKRDKNQDQHRWVGIFSSARVIPHVPPVLPGITATKMRSEIRVYAVSPPVVMLLWDTPVLAR